MHFHFKDRCRCKWKEVSNGIIKALFEPTSTADDVTIHPEFVLLNMSKDRGEPELGREYLVEINPAFPH